ncbi:hypothetical protein ABZT49_19730 [Methylobacterium sp. EM32]|uniref:hypothetical protein n=1 Tax=Methylobacterium sp. EM32 TaxID=3163481 RepID=UPI0033A2A661
MTGLKTSPTPMARLAQRIRSRAAAAFGLLAALAALPGAARAEVPDIAAVRAADVLDFLGVNTHIAYTDSRYADPGKIIEALRFLGIRQVRDSIPNPAVPGNGWYNYPTVAQAGIRFNFLAGSGEVDLKDAITRLEQFEQQAPGAIVSVEGPNEYNNWPFPFNGRTGNEAAVEFQNGLDAGLRKSPLLKHIPMYNLTTWPPAFGRYDQLTIHVYPKGGEQPRAAIDQDVEKFSHDGRFFPASLTEIGYYTLQKRLGWGGVDALTQARLTLNTVILTKQMGFSSIYLYELFDAYPDPEEVEVERHFGLFTADYAPKPAAEALRRFTVALDDQDDGARSFTPEIVRVGLDVTGAHLLVCQRSSGEFVIALADERPVWDREALAPLAVPDRPVKVSLDRPRLVVSATDAITGEALPVPEGPVNEIPVTLRGNAILLVMK